jgi:hypothetical protein
VAQPPTSNVIFWGFIDHFKGFSAGFEKKCSGSIAIFRMSWMGFHRILWDLVTFSWDDFMGCA